MASTQPNPSDLTNALLLRILQHNYSFSGSEALEPVTNVSSSALRAQTILFASLALTLFAAFITILGMQWILSYKETLRWGLVFDPEKRGQLKFVGVRRKGLHYIVESLPFFLLLALLLFGTGLTIYLWDLNLSPAEAILAVTCIECVFYSLTTVIAVVRRHYPLQTPLSIFLSETLPRRKVVLLLRVCASLKRWLTGPVGKKTTPDEAVDDDYDKHSHMKFSNPAFWRKEPLFTSALPEDAIASAGSWLLENPTDFSAAIAAATAVATIFPTSQWLYYPPSSRGLTRFYTAYIMSFQVPTFDKSARLKALQSAAAYYLLYRTRLLQHASKGCEDELEKLPHGLSPDPLLAHSHLWGGYDLFQYLLHIEDRSKPVESVRFLSYIAPYWFCGDSDAAVKSRSDRLYTMYKLIAVLERSKELDPETLTNCVLCVGAAMDFPLHPKDLIRVDKRCVLSLSALRAVLIGDSDYLGLTFEMVVEHIHQIMLADSYAYHALRALDILLTLVKCARIPFIDAAWMNKLLKRAAEDSMKSGIANNDFVLFLKLSMWRKISGDATIDM